MHVTSINPPALSFFSLFLCQLCEIHIVNFAKSCDCARRVYAKGINHREEKPRARELITRGNMIAHAGEGGGGGS